nr:MAG TPA: hypothetical protein [Caudoviricetes sp.]
MILYVLWRLKLHRTIYPRLYIEYSVFGTAGASLNHAVLGTKEW